MARIAKDQDIVTLINVFTVAPENQQRLLDLLAEATEQVMRHQPGFISANLHKSLDGTRVTNYAQWESEASFTAMQRNADAAVHMREVAQLAASFEPHLYTVDSVHEA